MSKARLEKLAKRLESDKDLAEQILRIKEELIDEAQQLQVQSQLEKQEPIGVANATFIYAFNTINTEAYPSARSAILDSGTTIHIFNDLSRFEDFKKAPRDQYIVVL